jgi:hypothetical protein
LLKRDCFLPVLPLAKILVLVVCCVVCCLAFSEFPETFNLSDDSSNDFVVVSEAYTGGDAEGADIAAMVPAAVCPTLHLVLSSNIESFSTEPASVTNLLPLISLRRI